MLQVVAVAQGTHYEDTRKPHRGRLPGSPIFRIPDLLEISCAKGLLLEAKKYGYERFVGFDDFSTELSCFVRLKLHISGTYVCALYICRYLCVSSCACAMS